MTLRRNARAAPPLALFAAGCAWNIVSVAAIRGAVLLRSAQPAQLELDSILLGVMLLVAGAYAIPKLGVGLFLRLLLMAAICFGLTWWLHSPLANLIVGMASLCWGLAYLLRLSRPPVNMRT